MVGWPPVRNFRKTLVQQQPPRPAPPQERQPRPTTTTTTTPQVTTTVVPLTAAAAAAPTSNGTQVTQTSFLVKVYMDGLSIGRKVDLTANNSYERLKSALEDMFQDMFQQFISMSFATSLSFTRSKLLRMIWICLYPATVLGLYCGVVIQVSSTLLE